MKNGKIVFIQLLLFFVVIGTFFAVPTLAQDLQQAIEPAVLVEQSQKQLRELYIALIALVVGSSLAFALLLMWIIHHHHSPHTFH